MEKYIISKNLEIFFKQKHLNLNDKINVDTFEFEKRFGIGISDLETEWFRLNINIWKHFAEYSNQEFCLILEEGVKIKTDFDEIESELLNMNDEWDIFFPYDKINNKNENIPISISRFGFYWGTYSYFINKKTICNLLKVFKSITGPLDEELLTKGIQKEIRFYCAPTKWFEFDQPSSLCLLERNKSIATYITEYNVWEKKDLKKVNEILAYLSQISNELDLAIFLHAGTLLGAVRHAKIMNWDDDVDLMMDRKEAALLIDIISKDNKYKFTEWIWPKTGQKYYKIWALGGFKVDGYEYTFPFVDI